MHTEDTQSKANLADIEQLNSFLRGEIAAVATYDQALEKIDDAQVTSSLRAARSSHNDRVGLLRQRITLLGGKPSEAAGVWGSFAKLVEGSAIMFGVGPAVAALEEGEDHGNDDYRADLHDLSVGTQTFVSTTILPEQLRTHEALSSLKRQLAGKAKAKAS